MVGHLIPSGGLAKLQVKTGQLQVQPLADSSMQGTTSPKRRQAVQPLFAQNQKSLPGVFLKERQGSSGACFLQ